MQGNSSRCVKDAVCCPMLMFIRGLAFRAMCQLTEKGHMLGPMLILQPTLWPVMH